MPPRKQQPTPFDRTPDHPKTDGLGKPLVADALYYVLDARQVVGNCGSWWAPNGAGYVCTIDEAGTYTGKYCTCLRPTDVPWPVDYVNARAVRHVRVDTPMTDWTARRDTRRDAMRNAIDRVLVALGPDADGWSEPQNQPSASDGQPAVQS